MPKKQLRKLIINILTDSRAPGEPKATEGSALFQLYQAFASAEETAALAQAYAEGIAWGDAKQLLFERLEREIAPLRTVSQELMQNPAQIEKTLKTGAEKARSVATPFTARLRHAVGLRALDSAADAGKKVKATKTAAPSFKQYRESDGLFYFKLLDAQGELLLQSNGFTSPRDAAQTIERLQKEGIAALDTLASQLASRVDTALVNTALSQLAEAREA
jgi:tryptophanyl-tRNA synthetase